MRVTQLLPEHHRALQILENHIDIPLSQIEDISSDILREGCVMRFEANFSARYLPSARHWRWNQTKSRKHAVLDSNNAVVEFFKLSPRKRKVRTSGTIPNYKMWQYKVTKSSRTIFFVWCERGVPSNSSETKFEPSNNESVDFFSEFICGTHPEINDIITNWPENSFEEFFACI